jgi:hypothetical protein
MITIPPIAPQLEGEQVYNQAIKRIQTELGWTPGKADSMLAGLAAGYGVLIDDVAAVVVDARTLKRGLSFALSQAVLDRRPRHLRHMPNR